MKRKPLYTGIFILVILCATFYFYRSPAVVPVTKPISNATSTITTIQECWDSNFGISSQYTPPEKQRDCALLTLADAQSIKIDNKNIGDNYTLSDIKSLATDGSAKASSQTQSESYKCWNDAGHIGAWRDCDYLDEKLLQDVIRSLVKMNIDKEQTVSGLEYEDDPGLYTEYMKKEWQDWYISVTGDTSEKNTRCTIETDRTDFGGSISLLDKSSCFTKQNAIEILWLLDKINEVREDRRMK